jgi:hypothetical protein
MSAQRVPFPNRCHPRFPTRGGDVLCGGHCGEDVASRVRRAKPAGLADGSRRSSEERARPPDPRILRRTPDGGARNSVHSGSRLLILRNLRSTSAPEPEKQSSASGGPAGFPREQEAMTPWTFTADPTASAPSFVPTSVQKRNLRVPARRHRGSCHTLPPHSLNPYRHPSSSSPPSRSWSSFAR